MALADTARLVASLDLKGNFSSQIRANEKALGSFETRLDRTQSRSFRAGQQIGTGIKRGAAIAASGIGLLITQIGFGLRSLATLEDASLQTNAVLKSTKGVSGQTAESVRNLAEQYEALNATIDDKVIQSGENLLLTFTNIRKDAFEPTLKAALNMNQALGGGEAGLQGTIQRLGKALNDPIKGLSQLGRVGVTFTKVQKEQIKTAVEAGDTFKAQSIILAELEKRFGGSFQAAGTGAKATVAGIGDAVEDLQKAVATGLFPVLEKVLPKVRGALADPSVLKGAKDIGDAIASIFTDDNLAAGADFLKGAFETAKDAAPVVKEAASATFNLVKGAVGLFRSLPPEIQKLAVGAFAVNKLTGGLVTNIAGGIIDAVGKNFLQKGGSPANPLFVSDVTGGLKGGAAAAAGGATSKLGKVASAVSKVFLVGAAIGVFAELKGVLDEQSARNKQQASDLNKQTQDFVKVAGIEDMKRALAGIEADVANSIRNDTAYAVAYNLNIDGVRDAINTQKATLVEAIRTAEGKAAAMQVAATERSEAIASQKADQIRKAAQAAAMATRRVEAAENRSARTITARLAAAQRAQVGASRQTAAEIRKKRWQFNNSVVVNTSVRVSARETSKTQTTMKRGYVTLS